MTYIAPAEYALPLDFGPGRVLGSPAIDPGEITVVVPVKDDQQGLLPQAARSSEARSRRR